MSFAGWNAASPAERAGIIRTSYGAYPIPVTIPVSHVAELKSCLDSLLKGDEKVLIAKERRGYVVHRAPTPGMCDVKYDRLGSRFSLTPVSERWVCEVFKEREKDGKVVFALHNRDCLEQVRELARLYEDIKIIGAETAAQPA